MCKYCKTNNQTTVQVKINNDITLELCQSYVEDAFDGIIATCENCKELYEKSQEDIENDNNSDWYTIQERLCENCKERGIDYNEAIDEHIEKEASILAFNKKLGIC